MKTRSILFNRLIISSILCLYLFFFLFLLQPFDSINYNHPYKTVQLFGYGLISFFSYFITDTFSSAKKLKFNKNFVVFFLLGSSLCFVYNTLIINHKSIKIAGFFFWIITYALPVFVTISLQRTALSATPVRVALSACYGLVFLQFLLLYSFS